MIKKVLKGHKTLTQQQPLIKDDAECQIKSEKKGCYLAVFLATFENFICYFHFVVQVIDDMIFAIGGFNGVTTIFNVECYDGTTDEWFVIYNIFIDCS